MSTQQVRAGEFILSEGNGHISRDEITILNGQGVLQAGTVLGKVTASGKYVAYDNAATNGSQTAAGVLYAQVDATSADATALGIMRHAEVKASFLTGFDTAAKADLEAISILVR